MADAYSQTISGEVATTLGANNRKVRHDTFNYGTPRVYPLVLVHGTNWSGHANANSDLFKVLNYLQGRGVEIYGVGQVSGNTVTILVNWEKTPKDDGDEQEPDDTSDVDLLTDEINSRLGITCRVWYGKIQGSSVSHDC
jgi:hypothetical protein